MLARYIVVGGLATAIFYLVANITFFGKNFSYEIVSLCIALSVPAFSYPLQKFWVFKEVKDDSKVPPGGGNRFPIRCFLIFCLFFRGLPLFFKGRESDQSTTYRIFSYHFSLFRFCKTIKNRIFHDINAIFCLLFAQRKALICLTLRVQTAYFTNILDSIKLLVASFMFFFYRILLYQMHILFHLTHKEF